MSLFPFWIEPEDKMEHFRWVQSISLPVSVQLYRYSCGNYYGNLNFIWKIKTTNDDMMMKAVDAVCMMIATFSTRDMRMEIRQRYSREIQPSLLRNIFSFITKYSSAAETSHLQRVDDNAAVFLAESDDPDVLYDLWKLNGSYNSLDLFWGQLKEFLNEGSIVHNRRQGKITYLPVAITFFDLIRQIKDRLPEGAKCPSESWVRLQFWLTNPYSESAMHYTG